MRRLSRRWEPFHVASYNYGRELSSSIHRTFLSEPATVGNPEPIAWGCIETHGPVLEAPYRLEVWDNQEEEWEFVQDFPTLKQAKEVGRLLAGIALAKNI